MIWIFVGFQLLFDFGVCLLLLALFTRVRELRRAENRETPPAWREELLSTLDRLLAALADRLPPAAPVRTLSHGQPLTSHPSGPRPSGPASEVELLGESRLASRLEAKRRFSASS